MTNETTDTTLDAWKRWIEYRIFADPSVSILREIPVRLRDSSDVKSYPGIYLSEGSIDRIEAGGVQDGNAWEMEIVTELKTTPGEDGELATSREAHAEIRSALSKILNSCNVQSYMDSQIGLACHQLLDSSPITDDQDNYRVTTWRNEAVVCLR